MLVLSRKVGERIVIAGDIEIGVVRISENKVVLGVTAPSQVSINRLEVQERINEEIQLDRRSPGRNHRHERR